MNMNATLLGQVICFALFVWFCMKFVWPPIMNAIEKRQKEIAESLTAAEAARHELAATQANSTEIMQQAKAQAQMIIDEANKRKQQLLDEAKQEALLEKEKLIKQGLAELEAEHKKVQSQLRQQVAQLVVSGAEKVIKRSVDEAANRDIVDEMIAKL